MSVIKERRSIIAKIQSTYFINGALLDLWCNLNLSLESKESCGLRKIDSRRDPGPQPAELLRLLWPLPGWYIVLYIPAWCEETDPRDDRRDEYPVLSAQLGMLPPKLRFSWKANLVSQWWCIKCIMLQTIRRIIEKGQYPNIPLFQLPAHYYSVYLFRIFLFSFWSRMLCMTNLKSYLLWQLSIFLWIRHI